METSAKSAKISLSNPSIHTEMLKTTVNYIISTQTPQTLFTSTRTYEEFLHMRKLLIQKWPGIYIPPLPAKSFLSNLSNKHLKTYKAQLLDFLNYISTIPFIYDSEEFQCFLKSPEPFTLKFSFNIPDLSLTYQAIFHEYSRRALNDITLRSLSQEHDFFLSALQKIIDLRDKAEVLLEDFQKFHNLLAGVSNSLEKNEKLFITAPDSKDIFVHPDLTGIKNSFKVLFLWAESEVLQLESINEAICFVAKLEKLVENCENGIGECQKEVQKVENNQISIVKIFSFKSKDKFMQDKNMEIARKQNEVMNLEKFKTIVALRLVEKDIPWFKKDRIENFERIKKKYNEIVQGSMELLRNAASATLSNVSRFNN